MAAPGVIPGIMDLVGLHRVAVDVANDRCQVLIGIDKNGLVAAPEQRAIPSVSSIKSLRVDTINMTHGPSEVSLWCLEGQVVVGVHETVRKYPDIPTAPCIFE